MVNKLPDYNQTFVHIKGTNKILADAIFRLRTLDIYRDPIENPKIQQLTIQKSTAKVVANEMQTFSNDRLHAKQRKTLIVEIKLWSHIIKNRNCFKLVMTSTNGILQKQQYIHGLK